MGVARWKAVSDFKELERDFAKLQKENTKLLGQNKKLSDQSKKAQTAAQNAARAQSRGSNIAAAGAKRAANSIRNMAASYLGVSAAIQMVIGGIKEQHKLEDRTLQRNLTVAESQAAVRPNLGDVTTKEFNRFLDDLKKISKESGVGVAPINLAASDILSAVSGSQKQTKEILRVAAPLFRSRPAELATFGGSLGDVMKSGDFKSGVKATALMVATQSVGRFVNLDAFKNLAPALAAGRASSPDAPAEQAVRQTLSLAAGIGSAIGDKEAAITGTLVANLEANLARVVPGKKTTFERLQVVRQDPALQEEVARSGFRGAVKPTVQAFLAGKGGSVGLVDEAFKAIIAKERVLKNMVSDLKKGTPQLALQTLEAKTSGAEESFQLSDNISARRASARRITEKARGITSDSIFWATRGIRNRMDMAEGGAKIDATDRPLAAATKLIQQRRRIITGAFIGDEEGTPDLSHLSQRDQRKVASLNELLAEIKAFQTAMNNMISNNKASQDKANDLLTKLNNNVEKNNMAQQNVNKGNANAARGKHTEN